MKKLQLSVGLLMMLLLTLSTPLQACETCGCSNSSLFFGVLPQSHLNFAGVRYRTNSYLTHAESTVLRTREHYQSVEIWGRFYPIKRVQVMAFLPYHVNRQETRMLDKELRGVGDLTILAHYALLNTFMDDSKALRINHTLQLGGGVKLPTGEYRYDAYDLTQVANPNFQLGSGSTDFMTNILYTVRGERWGAGADLTAKVNTVNTMGYRFGNRAVGSINLFRTIEKTPDWTLMPYLGAFAEGYARDYERGRIDPKTGGWAVFATAGVELTYRKVSLGTLAQIPLAHYLNKGEVVPQNRFTIQTSYLF